MKVRTRSLPPEARPKAPRVWFSDFPQPSMMVVKQIDEIDVENVSGAYVKLQPTITASERGGIDLTGTRRQLLKAGAAAVVVAPIVVPDRSGAPAGKRTPQQQRPQQYLEAWLANAKGSRKVLTQALTVAMECITEAGL